MSKKVFSRSGRRITAVLLAILTVFVCLLLPACTDGVNEDEKEEKNAIIIIPGLFASALYEEDTGEPIWDPFTDNDLWITDLLAHSGMNYATILALLQDEQFLAQLNHITANGGLGDGESFLYKLTAMTDDGKSVYNIKPVSFFDADSRLRYGLMNAQTEIYNDFHEKYGSDYEVSVFNYDFRLDNRDSAALLQTFIDEKEYDNVIFVTHSNGGLVVARYLAMSEENRAKVRLNLSYDAPYLGSVLALSTLENLDGMADDIYEITDSLGLKDMDEIIDTAFRTQFLPLANMYVVYQLLPTYELLCSPHFYNYMTEHTHTPGQEVRDVLYEHEVPLVTKIDANGKKTALHFDSEQELYDFYCSRPWAHLDNDVEKPLRAGMKDWLDYCDSMYVETATGKVHSTTLVDSVYFCGTGYRTDIGVAYKTYASGETVCYYDTESELGDGTVLLYSASAGVTDSAKIRVVPHANHFDPVQEFLTYSADMTDAVMKEFLKK